MRILDLSLTYHWFDLIKSGIKKEEYREIKPFYTTRLENKEYDYIRFHRGQGSPVTMFVKYLGCTTGKGNVEWGAPIDKEVFIIKLGEIFDKIPE